MERSYLSEDLVEKIKKTNYYKQWMVADFLSKILNPFNILDYDSSSIYSENYPEVHDDKEDKNVTRTIFQAKKQQNEALLHYCKSNLDSDVERICLL